MRFLVTPQGPAVLNSCSLKRRESRLLTNVYKNTHFRIIMITSG
jgi:hypothetical protein